MTDVNGPRLVAVENSIYRLAHEQESQAAWRSRTDACLQEIERDVKTAAKCRNALRGDVLDLKTLIVQMREASLAERKASQDQREALSSSLAGKIKTATIAKAVGTVAGAALLGLIGAMVSPETAETVRQFLESIQ